MFSDIENARKLMELLGDEGFITALSNAEETEDGFFVGPKVS